MRRPLACGQLCRAPPGELPRGRRSLAAGAICTNGAVFTLRRHAGEQRCAARWPAASCAGPHRENCPEVGVPWRPVPSPRMAVSLPCGVMRGSSDAPPAGLRPAVPTGGRRSLAAGVICTNGDVFALRRHPGEQRFAARWPAASCAGPHRENCPEVGVPWRLVPSARMAVSLPCGVIRGSSDSPPAGLRPAVPGPTGRTAQRSAFPGGWCHLHEWRCLCLAASPPAGLRPAVPMRRSSDAPPAGLRPAVPGPTGRTAQRSAFQAVPALFWRGGVLPSAQKTMAANSVRCLHDRGESVKGGPPFHKSTMTNRNSPPRAAGAQGSFDCRREAPGGPRTGPQLQAELRPKAIPDQGPVRGPLDPDCRSETGAPLSRAVPRIGGRRYPPGRPSPAGGRISPLWRFERPSFSWVGDCSWSHWPGS